MEPVVRLLRANNLDRALAAIEKGNYPIAFHVLNETFGKIKPSQIDGDFYLDMTDQEAKLFRTAINHAWRRERSHLSTDTMEGMTRDNKPLSDLDEYLKKSGLVWVEPGMSHAKLQTKLIQARNPQATWRYLATNRQGPQEFEIDHNLDVNSLIASITERARPVVLWTTRVALRATANTSELFGWATIEIKFGRMSEIRQKQGGLQMKHVNLRCNIQGIPEADQPVGATVLDQTIEASLASGKISLTTWAT